MFTALILLVIVLLLTLAAVLRWAGATMDWGFFAFIMAFVGGLIGFVFGRMA